MKKLIIILSLHLLALPSLAQTALLEEGNVWTYCMKGYDTWHNDSVFSLYYVEYIVKGERTWAGRQYKKIWVRSAGYPYEEYLDEKGCIGRRMSTTLKVNNNLTYCLSLREEDGIIYSNIEKFAEDAHTSKEDVKSCYPCKGDECILYDVNEYTPYDFAVGSDLIPGVGWKHSFFLLLRIAASDGFVYKETLNLFYRNGVLEYKAPDFEHDYFFPDEEPSGIKGPTAKMPTIIHSLFDLTGRRITTPPVKGVWIEDGKKRVR